MFFCMIYIYIYIYIYINSNQCGINYSVLHLNSDITEINYNFGVNIALKWHHQQIFIYFLFSFNRFRSSLYQMRTLQLGVWANAALSISLFNPSIF